MTKNMMAVILFLNSLSACQPKTAPVPTGEPSQLLKVSQSLSMMGSVTAETTLSVIDLYNNKALDKGQTELLLGILEKTAHAGKEATETVRKLSTLTDADRKNLSLVIQPLLEAVDDGLKQVARLGPDAQVKAKAILLALQSVIAITQASLEAR